MRGWPAGDAQHQIGALDADPAKREEFFQIAWQLPAVIGDDLPRDFADLRRFRFVKRTADDQGVDLRHG